MTVTIAYLADEQSGGPAGVRVVEPSPDSNQAQRGNLYAVVDLREPADDQGANASHAAAFAERLLSAIQRTYYTAKGTQSQVMTATLQAAQQLLYSENAQRQTAWRAGIICVGLLNDRLAIGGLGDAFAFATTDGGDVNVYPPERLNPGFGVDNSLTLWPLHRQKIEVGGAILAGSGRWLDAVSPRVLAGATAFVAAETCQDAADGLREQAGDAQFPGILLVFSSTTPLPPFPGATSGRGPATPPPSPGGRPGNKAAPPTNSQAVAAAPVAATVAVGATPGAPAYLPTARHATPPVIDAPPLSNTPPDPARDQPAALPVAAEEEEAAGPATGAYPDDYPAADPPARSAPSSTVSTASSTAQRAAASAAATAAASAAVALGVTKAGLERARGMIASMLPDRSAFTHASPEGSHSLHSTAAAGTISADAATLPRAEPFTPPPAASGSRARLFLAIAAILLFLIPAIVAGLYWQQGATSRAQAESLLDLGQARLLSAQNALDQEDNTTARAMLTEANEYVLQAQNILGSTARSADLLEQIRREQQQVMQITPLYGLTTPLATYPAEASPQRVLVIGQDVYVLDAGRGEVLRYRLDVNGETLAEDGRVVLREGDVVNGVPIGRMVDIAWQLPIPMYQDKASLLLLDANNRVFRYNEVDAATLVSFGDPSPWQKATHLEVFSDRLYVTDEGANQIYRYAPGTYQDPPTPWFQPSTQVRLQGIKALRIDGDIWLLFGDGKVVRYHAGEQVPYGLDNTVALATDPVDLYVSQAAGDKSLYLADAAEERILFFDKDTGKFEGQFQAAEGRPLRGLRSIFIDEARHTLYILTREALYVQRLPR